MPFPDITIPPETDLRKLIDTLQRFFVAAMPWWKLTYTAITTDGLDHGLMSGLTDDDHAQYLNSARHAAITAIHVTNGNSHDHSGGDGAQIDHGGTGGLTDDDHTQYLKLAGRATGQTAYGGTAANDDITIDSTSDSTKGYVLVQPSGGSVGIGTSSPDTVLHVAQTNATPVLRLERIDTTIGTNDIVGRLEVEGQDAAAQGVCAKLEAIGEGNDGETGWRFSTGVAGSSAEVMRLTYTGYLGLGVTEPDSQLHVENATGAVQRMTRNDTDSTADDVIGRIEFETRDSGSAGVAAYIQALTEDSDGEVGIAIATGTGGSATERIRIANTGEVTLVGDARVYKTEWISVSGFAVPGTKPATRIDWGISSGWEFSDATDDTIYAVRRLPQDMDITVAPEFKIGWASATADPGDNSKQVVWQVEYLYRQANEDTTAAAQGSPTATTSASTTAKGLTISTITGLDLPSASDQLLMVRIKRLGADGDDDLGDDCTLLGFGFKYVSNKFGVAL